MTASMRWRNTTEKLRVVAGLLMAKGDAFLKRVFIMFVIYLENFVCE